MPDSDKVIKGIEHCLSRYVDGLCDDCPYMGELDKSYMIPMKCKEIIMRDALALLKGQEAKWIYGEDETGVDGWHCSYCGFFEPWFYEFTDDIDFIRFYSFCPSCGRRMTSYTGKPTQKDE